MIRKYRQGDNEKLKHNDLSNIEGDSDDALHSDECIKYTQCSSDGEVRCIIGFYKCGYETYAAFFLMSEDTRISEARELKYFVSDMRFILGWPMVKTCSRIEDEALDRWHSFLGFEDRINMEQDGKQYNLWVIKWGSKR